MYSKLKKDLQATLRQLTPVGPVKLEVLRDLDRQIIYSIGEGSPHQLSAMESQVRFLTWLGEDVTRFRDVPLLLLGERKSGTSWAGLVATISLVQALGTATRACVYCGAAQLKLTHTLIREILPASWVDEASESEGRYRLPQGAVLQVVAFTHRKKWPTQTPSIVMINDYSLATEAQLDASLGDAPFKVICGNPPLASERTRGWITRMRDQTRNAGTFFGFWTKQNQSVRGNTKAWDFFANVTNQHVPGFLEDSPPTT